jgi:hypothetical protein
MWCVPVGNEKIAVKTLLKRRRTSSRAARDGGCRLGDGDGDGGGGGSGAVEKSA